MTREWLDEMIKIEANVIKLARDPTKNKEREESRELPSLHIHKENEIQKETK